jgi:hypothetical protein
MKKFLTGLVLVGVFSLVAWVGTGWCDTPQANKDAEIPKIVLAGLDACKTGGLEKAAKEWSKGSVIEGDEVPGPLKTYVYRWDIYVDSYYGSYKSFETVRIVDITTCTKLVYMVMNFEKGPVFVKFLCYKKDGEWIIPSLFYSWHPESVFPWLGPATANGKKE